MYINMIKKWCMNIFLHTYLNTYLYIYVYIHIYVCVLLYHFVYHWPLIGLAIVYYRFVASIQAEQKTQKTWLDSVEPSEPAEPSFSSLLPAPKVSSWPVDPSWVFATQIFLLCSPRKLGKMTRNFGEDEPIWTNICQSGWNHQLASYFQGLVGCTPTEIPLWEIPKRSPI